MLVAGATLFFLALVIWLVVSPVKAHQEDTYDWRRDWAVTEGFALSVDTEGSELLILQKLDFTRYEPKIITVEHNYTSDREPIRVLLAVMGYVRMFESFTKWDDWYVKSNLL